jgi:hypothetical protein
MELDTSKTTARAILAAIVLSSLSFAGASMPARVSAQDVTSEADLGRVYVDLYRPRTRFGLSGVGGGFAGVVQGGAAGLAPRVGVQLDDVFAVYLQVHALLGNFDSSSGGSRLAGFLFHALMVEVTANDRFQVGLGPSLDFAWNCREQNDVDPCGDGEARVGGDLRIALALGDEVHREGSRHGLAISLEVHPTWLDPDFSWMMLFGIGADMY